MVKLSSLYRSFRLKQNYENMDEEKILSGLYAYKTGSIEEVVSYLINDAVLKHMYLYIDSTIMQVVELNKYLSDLFLSNLETLMFNYCIYQLEVMELEVIDEGIEKKLEDLAKSINMSTSLESVTLNLEDVVKE